MAKTKTKATKKKSTSRNNTSKTAKKKPVAKSKKSTSPTKSKIETNSVDAILKKFAERRTAKNTKLQSLNKKIVELETKIELLKDQVVKLKDDKNETQEIVDRIDQDRDEEVSEMLAKLGIQYRQPQRTPQSLFDSTESANSDSTGVETKNTDNSNSAAPSSASNADEDK